MVGEIRPKYLLYEIEVMNVIFLRFKYFEEGGLPLNFFLIKDVLGFRRNKEVPLFLGFRKLVILKESNSFVTI
jgi:hypothetical protein